MFPVSYANHLAIIFLTEDRDQIFSSWYRDMKQAFTDPAPSLTVIMDPSRLQRKNLEFNKVRTIITRLSREVEDENHSNERSRTHDMSP